MEHSRGAGQASDRLRGMSTTRVVRRLKARVRRIVFVLIGCMAAAVAAHAQPSEPPGYLDPVNRTGWSDENLGVRFSYPNVWQQALATQDSSRVVINWRLAKSKALLASCYLEVHEGTRIAALAPAEIGPRSREIASVMLANMRKRAPDAQTLEVRATQQDGHAVVFVVRQGSVQALDRRIDTKLWSLATAWRGREINFECGTEVFGPKYEGLPGGPELIKRVETAVLHVMKTIQFDR